MKNSIRRVVLVAVLALAVAGCTNLGGPNVPSPGTGTGTNSPPSADAVNRLLDAYKTHAEAGDWEQFAALYVYPVDMTVQIPFGSTPDSEEELRLEFEANRDERLADFQATVDERFPTGESPVRLVFLDIVNFRTVQHEGDVDEEDDPLNTFDLKMTLDVRTPEAGQVLFPELLFQSPIEEDEDEDSYGNELPSVTLTDLDIRTTGVRSIVQATSTVTVIESFEEEFFGIQSCTYVADTTFTVVRSGTSAKIEKQAHIFRSDVRQCN